MAPPLWLDAIGDGDRERVGAKAFTLARLKRFGFPVPDGFVIPAGEIDGPSVTEAFDRLGAPVAVRSSSTAEDREDASFAGQYRTVLDVRDHAALLDAIRTCRAAAGDAARYAGSLGVSGAGSLALFVQRFVEPTVAGVAFTRAPQDAACLLIEAHAGRGEALVSGEVTPEATLVERDGGRLRRAPPHTIDPAVIRDVARLAREVEERLGGPQDVEWAWGAAGLVLLQARPITVEPADRRDPRVRRLTRANVGEVMPDAVTPLTWSTLGFGLEHAFRHLTARLGLRGENDDTPPFLVLHQQRLYLNLTGSLDLTRNLPGVDPADAERLVLGIGTTTGHRPSWSLRSIVKGVGILPRMIAMNRRLPADIAAMEADVSGLAVPRTADAATLAAEMRRLGELAPRVATTHVATSGASAFRLALLGKLLPGWVHDPAALVNRLVAGQGDIASASSATELETIAAGARERPEILEWLAAPGERTLSTDTPAWLRKSLERFLERFGHRGLSEGELRAPAWADDPAPLLGALAALVRVERPIGFGSRVRAEWRRADTESLLSRAGLARRLVLREGITGAQTWVRERERTKSLAVAMVHHTRRLVRAAARVLVERGALRDADEVYFLPAEELIEILEGGPVSRARLLRRKRRFDREGLLPAPKEVDLQEPGGAGVPAAHDGPVLRGIGVSAGIGIGIARIVGAGRVPTLRAGEILVAPVLDAALAPHLASAAAAVAEVGGMLSHGSVVARELGVPCVVDVRDATTRIRDGDRIRVDGGAGTVTPVAEVGEVSAQAEEDRVTAVDVATEGLHALGTGPEARESIYINAYDPTSGVGLVAAMGIRSRGRGESLVALSLPDGRVLFGVELERAARGPSGFSVGGLGYTWRSGRLRFAGSLAPHEQSAFPPSPLPLLLAPRTHAVSISLELSEASPSVDFGDSLPADVVESLKPLGPHHLEQSGRFRGEIRIDGRTHRFDGTGSRDHSWGERDWEAADHWRLFTVHFGEDLSLLALALSVKGRSVQGGFLSRHGTIERLTRIDYATRVEGGRLRAFDLEVQGSHAAPLLLHGEVVRTVTVPVQIDRRPWRHLAGQPYRLLLHENHTRYTIAGRVSFGIAEFTERPL